MSEVPEQLQGQTGPLYDVVRELEAHASSAGWDQPEGLYALAVLSLSVLAAVIRLRDR